MKIASLLLGALLLPPAARAQTMQPVDFDEAPQAVVEEVDAHLDGGERDDLMAVVDSEGEVLRYFAEIEAEDDTALVLDPDGNLLFRGQEVDDQAETLPEAVRTAIAEGDFNDELIAMTREEKTLYAALEQRDDGGPRIRLYDAEGVSTQDIEVASEREAMMSMILLDPAAFD